MEILLILLLLLSLTKSCISFNFSKLGIQNLYPPGYFGKEPVQVHVGIYIESLGKFQSNEMSFDADFYLYMSWKDPSLAHNSSEYRLITDINMLKNIWIPDLYLANSRNAEFHDIVVPNFSLFIDKTGSVAYSGRITTTISCNFDLENFPMDRQMCTLQIVSYAYIASKVNVTWFDEGAIRYNEVGLPEFHIEEINAIQCDGTYRYAITEDSFKEAPFSCLSTNILLKRSAAYHVVQSYLPSALIVMISWVSFWIDRRAVHARITLWFTTLLSLFTLHMGVKNGLPETSCIRALDWWFAVCMILIFCTLTELAIVNTFMRKADKFERMAQRLANEKESRRESCFSVSTVHTEYDMFGEPYNLSHLTISYYADHKDNMEGVDTPRVQELRIGYDFARQAFEVDKISRFAFPIGFSMFNLMYWGYYLWVLN